MLILLATSKSPFLIRFSKLTNLTKSPKNRRNAQYVIQSKEKKDQSNLSSAGSLKKLCMHAPSNLQLLKRAKKHINDCEVMSIWRQ